MFPASLMQPWQSPWLLPTHSARVGVIMAYWMTMLQGIAMLRPSPGGCRAVLCGGVFFSSSSQVLCPLPALLLGKALALSVEESAVLVEDTP